MLGIGSIKMKVFWINIILAAGCIVHAGDFGNIDSEGGLPSRFKSEVNQLMSNHFNLSLKYLYTGIGYGSQQVQRPGMSKLLRELSNDHWNQGIDVLKRYFLRSGSVNDIFFNFQGKNEIALASTFDMRRTYLETLETLHTDSREYIGYLNNLHRMSANSLDLDFHDVDWGHFFEEKAEKEVERTRKLRGFITTLGGMSKSSLALNIFDSNL